MTEMQIPRTTWWRWWVVAVLVVGLGACTGPGGGTGSTEGPGHVTGVDDGAATSSSAAHPSPSEGVASLAAGDPSGSVTATPGGDPSGRLPKATVAGETLVPPSSLPELTVMDNPGGAKVLGGKLPAQATKGLKIYPVYRTRVGDRPHDVTGFINARGRMLREPVYGWWTVCVDDGGRARSVIGVRGDRYADVLDPATAEVRLTFETSGIFPGVLPGLGLRDADRGRGDDRCSRDGAGVELGSVGAFPGVSRPGGSVAVSG